MPFIGTHSGKFHCDEVFACWMLKTLPEYSEHVVLRSRDPDVLKTCDIVVDVGAVYDHSQLKYDHHQRSFNETMKTLGLLDFNTKLSSAGLIYAHYGKSVIAVLRNIPNGDPRLDILYKKMYENFVECCDAVDNGIPQYDGIPRYRLASTLTSRVNDLNPSWNEPEDSVNLDERFAQAMKLVGEEFTRKLKYYHESWLSVRDLVKQAIDKRYEVDPSGKIILFENGGVPWEEDFFNIEKEEGLEKFDISYALLADNSGPWYVQSIPLNELQTFENRAPLPEPWRGHRDADLEAICGIPGSIFVHASGFLGGTKTREGTLKMAIEALKILGKYKTI
uniref:Uncharacterized protein n=1 Tax=Acrobeloides nanus TaxID=290746 RepID=A0A914CZF5_9BILA